jgi:hypothetical protein
VQGAARHEHLLPARQHLAVGEVAHGEAVRVGRDHPHAVVVGGDQDAGQHGASIVAARRPHHLAQGLGDRCRRQRHRLRSRLDLLRVVVEAERADRELRAAGADADLLVDDVHLDGPRRQRAHDVGDQPGRHDHGAVALPADGDGEPDRQLEVGTRHGELVTAHLEAQAGQHGERAGAAGRRPAGGGQRIGQHLALASELHRGAFPTTRCMDRVVAVIGAVDWGQRVVAAA